jgi:hypothetical protein
MPVLQIRFRCGEPIPVAEINGRTKNTARATIMDEALCNTRFFQVIKSGLQHPD